MSEPASKSVISAGSEVFSEADLAPPPWEIRARRRARFDRAAAVIAVLALGLWAGGMVALGACAAPLVFALTPYPLSADAMGAVFARFDKIAVACAIVTLGCEVVRTLIDIGRATSSGRLVPRVRRYLGVLAAVLAIYSATQLTPEILRLHHAQIRRKVGRDGQLLDTLHVRAERIGKVLVVLAVLVAGLHVTTVRSARDEEQDDPAPGPLPPGPATTKHLRA